MKYILPLLLLSCLLTACPSSQIPVTSIAGSWSGTLTHTGDGVALPLTAVFTQTSVDLGGTASLGPVPYQATGDVTGKLEGNNATFAFSYLAGESSIGGEVTQTMGTYTLTGELSGNTLAGTIVGTVEGSSLSVPGTFVLERQ